MIVFIFLVWVKSKISPYGFHVYQITPLIFKSDQIGLLDFMTV
jgi:hypothetical protein